MDSIAEKSILVAGQLKTSRTEAVRDFLLDQKVMDLGVIGLVSPFAQYDFSKASYYKRGALEREQKLSAIVFSNIKDWNYGLIFFSFLSYIYAFFKSCRFFKRKFDLYIGISAFSAGMGLCLKKMGLVDEVVFYCLDFYPPQKGFWRKSIAAFIRKLDSYLIKRVDWLWDISPRIQEAREKYERVDPSAYKKIIVPLGYTEKNYPFRPMEQRARWDIGFLGSLSENQGLQLVLEALPQLIEKQSHIHLHIIGHGNYRSKLDEIVKRHELEKSVTFHGFVKTEEEVNEKLSNCVVGLATWTGAEDDNSLYADPGKPKQYGLVGLPIVITQAPWVSKVIQEVGAGVAVPYEKEHIVNGVWDVIGDDIKLKEYIDNVKNFKPYCLSAPIFRKTFDQMNLAVQ